MPQPNAYSREWFEFFHVGIDEVRTNQEAMFVARCAPLLDFRKVLDLCCGMGRHARALAKLGYSVVGIDRDPDVISQARKLSGGPDYVVAEILDYTPERGAFDVAIVMSQSFGYFDPETNRDVLARLAGSIRKGGRIILDLWNPAFFASHQGAREFVTPRGKVQENKKVDGDRLFVELLYPSSNREQFEWQLFSPAQMTEFARSVGLNLLASCTEFNANVSPSASKPRIQFVLEKQ